MSSDVVPRSSSITAGLTFSGASLVPVILWASNGMPRPMPVEVAALIGAGIISVSHALYNLAQARAATKLPFPPPTP